MTEPAREMAEALAGALQERLWGVVLFGSAARGEATASSDLDLLVVADGLPDKFTVRQRTLRALLPERVRGKASLIAKTREEWEGGFPAYYLDLGLDGVVLYDREGYVGRGLDRIRELTRVAGVTRARARGGFVWRWERPPRGAWRIDWSGVTGL